MPFAIPAIFSSLKFWLILAAVGAFVTFSYIWVDRTLSKIHELERKTAVLEVSNKQWEAVAKEQRENAELATKLLAERERELAEADRIRDRVTEEIERIERETDPDKLQVLIDKQSENMRRCLEIASGSPRTEADKDNQLCP